MDLSLVFLTCLYLATRLGSVSCMPTHHPNHHQKHGVLDSIAHCDAEQRGHILHQLGHRFKKELETSDMTLPPKETSVQVFIRVTYNVFNSLISDFEVHDSELDAEDNIPSWKIHKAYVKVVGGYKYSHTFSSDKGTYVLTMNNVKMHLIGNKCQIDLGQPDKVFSGSTANWGYQTYIKGTSKDDDNKEIKEKICHYVKRIYQEVLSKASCDPKTTTTTTTTPAPTEAPVEIITVNDLEPVVEVEEIPSEQPQEPSFESQDPSPDSQDQDPSSESQDQDLSSESQDPLPESEDPSPESQKPESHVPSRRPDEEDKKEKEQLHHHRDSSKSHVPHAAHHPSKVNSHLGDLNDEGFSNDEPLVIPGYLPFVDPEEKQKNQSKGSASRNSGIMVVAVALSILGRCFVMN